MGCAGTPLLWKEDYWRLLTLSCSSENIYNILVMYALSSNSEELFTFMLILKFAQHLNHLQGLSRYCPSYILCCISSKKTAAIVLEM